jgi:hypothetical protein
MNAPESSDPAALAVPGRDEIARTLRRHLAEHNLQVVLLAFLIAVASALLWLILFGFSYWMTLLFFSSVQGTNSAVPARFFPIFWSVAGALLFFAWIHRRLHPDERPRDYKSPAEIALDLILGIPRLTLAIFGTLSAWQRLSPHELQLATSLLEHLGRERRLPLPSLPLDIPDAAARFKILFALQLVQVIDVRRDEGAYWVMLNPLRPRALNLQERRVNAASVLQKMSR